MTEIVIFGGTTEGRELGVWCADHGITALVCVATDLGEKVLPEMPGVTSHVGRLGEAAMSALLVRAHPLLVIDATHPYATQVTATVTRVCAEHGLRYLRVRRAPGEQGYAEQGHTEQGPAEQTPVATVPDMAAALDWLAHTTGVIIATTGANEAAAWTTLPDFAERVVVRILPTVESVGSCLELGYPAKHLIAMQGPFGHDLNVALFRHYNAAIVVTKDSGQIGGFEDKLSAAAECGMTTLVIARPSDVGGVSLAEAETLIHQALQPSQVVQPRQVVQP